MTNDDITHGVASCDNNHSWPCTWIIAEDRPGEFRRIVRPSDCPQCNKKWKAVHTVAI